MGGKQRPQGGEEQQTAPVHFLPEAGQAMGEQSVGLLHGMQADQLQLPQWRRDSAALRLGELAEQLLATTDAQSGKRDFQAFCRAVQRAAWAVGFAQQAQGNGRAVLHLQGDVA